MPKKKKLWIIAALLLISIFTTGCFGQKTAEEKLFEIMENVADLEKGFEEQQNPLVELEKKENSLYEKIIEAGSKNHDEIEKLSDEAIAVANDRRKLIDKEHESIAAAKEKFETISPIIKEIDETEIQNKAKELYDLMIKRYESYNKLYDNYKKGIQYDIEMYRMLTDKQITMDQLDSQVTKINETYEIVMETNRSFNERTDKYNDGKLEFYKLAGFNVKTK